MTRSPAAPRALAAAHSATGRTAGIATKLATPQAIAILAMCLMPTACITSSKLDQQTQTSEILQRADPPRDNERVVVVPQSGSNEGFEAVCVRKALGARALSASAEFRGALLPAFEPGNVPQSETAFVDLLEHAHLQEKASALGVRYVIAVRGETVATDFRQEMRDMPFSTNTRRTSAFFQAWDLARAKLLGSGQYTATGGQGFGFLLVVPTVVWAPTESAVCEKVTQRLQEIFVPG